MTDSANPTDPATQPDPTALPNPFGQTRYQVRFDWGLEGADAIARDADIVIVVDVLPSVPIEQTAPETTAPETTASEQTLIAHPGLVVAGSLRNASAIARWVLDQQQASGSRLVVALVAAGERRVDGSTRFAVEDQLGSGAIIEALAALGLDASSPEAAVAGASFAGLRSATKHLISASGAGRALIAAGLDDIVAAEAPIDDSESVPVLAGIQVPRLALDSPSSLEPHKR